MELPITRPSRISYADELNLNELLGELKSKEYNGFIRITAGSEEGHILFKDGKQIAASYDNDSKMDAIKKIKSAADESSTLIEVFDLRDSQVNYLMDINKKYLLNSGSEVNDVLDELKKTGQEDKKIETPIPEEKPKIVEDKEKIETPVPEEKPEIVEAPLTKKEPEVKEAILTEEKPEINESSLFEQNESFLPKKPETQDNNEDVKNKLKSISMNSNHVEDVRQKAQIKSENNTPQEINVKTEVNEVKSDIEETKSAEVADEPIDRAELMKKYGLKDVGEEEVDNILESYKGGSLSDDDVEKIELTLMNKIKKSILSIPKIKGTEVMVFLDNTSELAGTINIITEYESKGFLSRFMGESKDLDNLKKQIINITQIEIKKSFRGYPEIVNNFKINVEVS